jgi:hypothetical protein
MAAFQALRDLRDSMLRPAALSGMQDPNWRIRRTCCRLLDDLALTPESTAALERRLDDPHPLARRAALHTLSCKHCKPDGCALDVRPLLERMAADSSRLVRRGIVLGLGWAHDPDLEPWVPDLVRRFAESDPSAQLREIARNILAQQEVKRRSNRERLRLPPELRARTERHRGEWVAIAGGRIVGVGDPRAFRHARRTWPDTTLYWVSAGQGWERSTRISPTLW